MGLFTRIKQLFSRKKPALGLALGSGGAKGMAHLGVLRALEEEGIGFSFVTGSSIGSIVGALYAKGYTSQDMVQIIENLNRREFSKNLRPFADLSFAEQFLENYLEGDFSTLSLPFAAWATEESGKGVMLKSGKLARALTASSAIPPFFRGVEIGGRRLYDGAFSDAVPSEACRQLGAEFVVGVDLSAFSKETERGPISRFVDSAVARFTPVNYQPDCRTRGYDHADFMFRPNLGAFRATDISRADMHRMYELGYEEAKGRMDEFKAAYRAARRKR